MEEIKQKLEKVIREVFSLEISPTVTPAPEETGADFASNVSFLVAKELHQSPREIGEKIAAEYGEGVEVAGAGFLNFNLADEYFLGKIEDFSEKFEENISSDEYFGQKIVCEFSDPNPFKVLHVGHLYTSIVGDAISRLFEFSGAEVVRANFGGDVGLHVAKTLFAMTAHSGGFLRQQVRDSLSVPQSTVRSVAPASLNSIQTEQSLGAEDELNFTIEDIAEAYVQGTRAFEEDEAAKKEIVSLNKEIYRINREKDHGSELAEIYWKGRELSYQYFEEFYASIGVKFDKFYPESSVAELGVTKVREELEKGVYEMSDGAVIFDGEKFGLHTRVFINQEGVPTYETKDVGLIFQKWEDWHFDKSVVITGNEQLDYMKVVLKSVEQFAPELTEKTVHLTHGIVRLPGNEKMSSRKGNFLKAVETIGLVREELGEKADERVVMAAIKYAFLKYKIGGNIIFDPKESVATTGNSGVYLLYSAVRAKKIVEKCQNGSDKNDFSLNKFEKKLVKKMIQYREVSEEAIFEMAPHKICNYLYELAQEFSRFYENVKVAGSEFESERKKIVQGYEKIMEHGLGLLGIEVPDEM